MAIPGGLPRRTELVAAALVLAAGLGEVWVPFSSRQGVGTSTSTTVGVVLAAVGMLCWRRAPAPALAFVMAEWGVLALVSTPYTLFYGTFVPFLLLVFSGARWGTGRSPAYVAGLGAVSLLSIDLFVSTMQEPGEIVFHWTVTILVWNAGELHDIVTHAVSSIVVQAGAAEQAVEDDPAFTRTALGHIRTTGNEALGEMRRLVAMLRATGEAPLQPRDRSAHRPGQGLRIAPS